MFIAETFTSLQGEGSLVGTPSFFVRTSGCNLRCRWCDTDYASWNPEGDNRSVEDLVEEFSASDVEHVVVTGGEPLLQEEIGELTRALRESGAQITVETAGTVAPDFVCDLLSVSPKTSNSDPDGTKAEQHRLRRREVSPLRRLLSIHQEHQIKFVVQSRADLGEILGVLDAIGPIEANRVLLMPEGRTAEEARQRARDVANLCLEHGFRYTPRLHLDLFGGGRGV